MYNKTVNRVKKNNLLVYIIMCIRSERVYSVWRRPANNFLALIFRFLLILKNTKDIYTTWPYCIANYMQFLP